jgi:hypothetical protein
MSSPVKFHITTRKPAAGDPGAVEVGYFVFANGLVTLTDHLGEPLPGGWNAELQNDEQPSVIARSLLRQMRSINRHARFNGPIRYPPRGFV